MFGYLGLQNPTYFILSFFKEVDSQLNEII
jgi:hypothetical protein